MYFKSISLTYVSLMFLILLGIMYVYKNKNANSTGKFYFALLITSVIVTIIELINPITMQYRDNISSLNEIVSKAYLCTLMLWGILFILYMDIIIFGNKHIGNGKKVSPIIVLASIAFIISCIIIIMSNIEYAGGVQDRPYVAAGIGLYFIYATFIIGTLIILLLLNIYRDRISNINLTPIILVLIAYIILILTQIFFNYEINELSLYCTFIMTVCYFTVESQDFKLIGMYQQSKVDAEKANNAKTTFLMKMSHEIRTPMNTILGYTQALLNDNNFSKDAVVPDIENVYSATNILNDLIDNILIMSNIEKGEMKVTNSNYFLENLIFEMNSLIPSKITDPETKFRIEVDQTLPKEYNGDAYKIYKILEYILLNAISCTSYGEVKLDIKGNKNEDSTEDLIFTVSNTGHVMSNDSFKKNFDDFISGTSNGEFDNARLGIIIAKELINLMDASIEFINEKGQGTKYIITLKQTIVNDTQIGNIFENVDLTHENKILDLTGKNILVVDDGEINLTMTKKSLSQFNVNVTTATSGKECVELVKNNNFDLIFLDQYMPDMDGTATVKALNSTGYKIPPIVSLTANTFDSLKNDYLTYGFIDYLHKPIVMKDLSRILRKVFVKEE